MLDLEFKKVLKKKPISLYIATLFLREVKDLFAERERHLRKNRKIEENKPEIDNNDDDHDVYMELRQSNLEGPRPSFKEYSY